MGISKTCDSTWQPICSQPNGQTCECGTKHQGHGIGPSHCREIKIHTLTKRQIKVRWYFQKQLTLRTAVSYLWSGKVFLLHANGHSPKANSVVSFSQKIYSSYTFRSEISMDCFQSVNVCTSQQQHGQGGPLNFPKYPISSYFKPKFLNLYILGQHLPTQTIHTPEKLKIWN